MVTYPAAGASRCRTLTMPVSSVIDVHDPRAGDYRLLGDPRELRTCGLFVAEGRLVVERMLRDARYGVDSLLLSPTCCAPRSAGPCVRRSGTLLRVPFARVDPWPASLQELRASRADSDQRQCRLAQSWCSRRDCPLTTLPAWPMRAGSYPSAAGSMPASDAQLPEAIAAHRTAETPLMR